jgi:hypothetical protein
MFQGFNNWRYLVFAVVSTGILILLILLTFKRKSNSKQLFLLGKEKYVFLKCLFLIHATTILIGCSIRRENINKIVENWFDITFYLNWLLLLQKRHMLTSDGIETFIIKGYSFNIIQWSSIREWSIQIPEKRKSVCILSFLYEKNKKVGSKEIEILRDDTEKIREVFEQYVACSIN